VVDVAQHSPADAAREAFKRHAWQEAYDAFGAADATGSLSAADLVAYADTAWWSGRPDEAPGIRERAYGSYLGASDTRAAAGTALRLMQDHAFRGAVTIASAWLGRAARLLENDQDSREYGYLRLMQGLVAGESGDPDGAIAQARLALEYGMRFGDPDLQALSLVLQGQALITKGEVKEGMKLVDEATIAAVTGELELFTTGIVFCSTIGACRDLGDLQRASEWTEAAMRWCERQSVNGFPGVCRIHRAEVLALRGALAKAEQEARLARDEISRFDMRWAMGESFYEIGSIRLRMGDLPAAEEAFRQAHEVGRSPEPGMSLIRLAEGKAAGANMSLQRALAGERSRPGRARLLAAQVEAALAAGDLATASAAADEFDTLAETFGTPAYRASALQARGELLLAEGDVAGSMGRLREAMDLWQKLDAPYEASRTRLALARALEAAGDADGAGLEIAAAKATFERIGAARDARAAAERLGGVAGAAGAPAGARVTRTFLFSDIVGSTSLVSVIGDEAWEDVIRWHDEALRAIVAEHGGQEIRHQGDGLVVSFDDPDSAIACAVAVQRRLADHRKAHGFAPSVRIGIHQATVTPRGLDYAGVGVHAAARVGGLAAGGEILVSRGTLDRATNSFPLGDSRTVELKGISGPVEVVQVGWR